MSPDKNERLLLYAHFSKYTLSNPEVLARSTLFITWSGLNLSLLSLLLFQPYQKSEKLLGHHRRIFKIREKGMGHTGSEKRKCWSRETPIGKIERDQ